jgi:predicted  nucleic acid-binding Zn-ribbon protein
MQFIKRMFAAADQAAEVARLNGVIADKDIEITDLNRESEKNAADAQAWRIKYEHATQKLATTGERYDSLRFVLVKALNEAANDD